ncbi:synaptotagmin-like protein 2 isoform X4 [Takifugu flavidus]|uniref:synaptotagmin-like protein 2 isoform X4 n=1 Tax=Takifugu flavidus TaxID=433684 RepID=UPI002544B5C4|nr:synaptotagmin-like protein 2 isoform X4 [Takifugu flavidus]
MIDLSHLTEEEQGAIMTVLRRDAELKRAEDDRVSKLEKTHNTGSKPDSQWKYLSGEWFYEAKSRRHMDKIHGSEVILASMKAQKAPFDGSPLSKRSPTPSSSGLKVGTPPKPARSLENLQLAVINDPEKEKKSPIFSPRMPRKNPFNQGSMIIYEAPDNISFVTSCQKPELSQTADASLLRSDPGEDFSQTSDTSSTSEGSSPAFRPVPRKRTFLSRHPSSSDPDAPVGPASIVPSPGQRRQLAQRVAAPQESPQQPMNDDDQPVYSEDKYGGTPSQKMDSSDTESGSDADVALEERREEPQDERLGERAALRSDVLRSSSIQDTVGGGDSAGPAGRPDELSLPQSTTDPDPPVSYDLNFIDKSDKQMKKSNQKNVFTLTTQSTSPTGDEESIAKVLDWFSRSTDRSDWLNSAGGAKVRMGSDHNVVVSKSRSEDSFLNEGEGTSELLQKKINEAKALRAAHRSASSELLEIEEPQQQVYVPHLRSVWERHKIGPKVLIIKSMMSKNRGQTPARLSDRHEGNKMDMTSEPGRYSREIIYKGESERCAVVRPQTDTEYTSPSSSSQEAHGPNTSARNYRNYSDLEAGAQAADRRGSDAGSVNVPRPRQERIFHPRLSVETESLSTSNPRPDRISQSTEIQLRDESSRTPKSEADLQTRYSPGSYSGNKSYVDNPQGGDDTLSPVRKALMRAETRSKSLEDLTASPVQERRQDTTADIRGASDVSSMPSPASSLFSDKDHLKNMSKSVPLFLQKEDDASTDSNSDQSYHSGQLTKGGSLTNLTSSSGLSSLSGSMMTMYGGDLEVQGNIMFSINYIQKLREFHIFVAQCQDLAAADLKKGRSNPYVKSYLVPDKSNLGKRKTSVKKKTLNPTFNEILRYRVNMEYLRTQTLILSVWHHDTFGRNSFLGEVDVDLFKWDFGHTRLNYFPLKSRTPPNLAAPSGRGQLKLAIRYLPQISHSEGVSHFFNGEIHIWVKECRDLPLIRATINPYVKCFVLPDTSRKSRQKTRVVRRAVDPVFNHTMVYDGIRDIDLTEACVELTVWDRDKLATNLLGGLRLGIGTGTSYGALVDWMDSTPSEVALWERMKSTPNEWVEDVLPLRILNPARATFK